MGVKENNQEICENTLQPVETKPVSVLGQLKDMMNQDRIKEKFKEVLGKKAPQFMASVTNAVSYCFNAAFLAVCNGRI